MFMRWWELGCQKASKNEPMEGWGAIFRLKCSMGFKGWKVMLLRGLSEMPVNGIRRIG